MQRDKPQAKGDTRAPGALGTHPVSTALGGVAGAVAAGAVVGTAAGPMGTAVGAAIGAAGGAIAGKLIANLIDPRIEENYWRSHWGEREYTDRPSYTFEQDWAPAYRYGVESFMRDPNRQFTEVELELSRGWGRYRGASKLDWDLARNATLDAWQRARDLAEREVPDA